MGMEQAIEKANMAMLGLHWDFSTMGALLAEDIHALDIRYRTLQTSVGVPRPVSGIAASSLG